MRKFGLGNFSFILFGIVPDITCLSRILISSQSDHGYRGSPLRRCCSSFFRKDRGTSFGTIEQGIKLQQEMRGIAEILSENGGEKITLIRTR